jgi:hypothetical protein
MDTINIPINGFWQQIFQNKVFWIGFAGWAVAQSIKTTIGIIDKRHFDFRWFVGSGGMPSSHSAGVIALSMAVGNTYGFSSPLFAVCISFSFITMFDAQGVRRQCGKQASALNTILDDVYAQKGIQLDPLKELFGHTPVEVIAGGTIGVIVASLLS